MTCSSKIFEAEIKFFRGHDKYILSENQKNVNVLLTAYRGLHCSHRSSVLQFYHLSNKMLMHGLELVTSCWVVPILPMIFILVLLISIKIIAKQVF